MSENKTEEVDHEEKMKFAKVKENLNFKEIESTKQNHQCQ
jgi:hypothetical protein